MAKHVIEYNARCDSCKGSGLYCGFAEKKGFTVVCRECKGTGKVHKEITYYDFEKRVERKDVKRVLQHNPGFGIGTGQVNKDSGNPIFVGSESFGGLSYKDWKAGKPFVRGTEMREFVCPAWWYQSADYSKKPKWDECIGCGSFSDCKNFINKEKCWEKFDKQYEKDMLSDKI